MSEIQSVLFNKKGFTIKRAKAWLKRNNFKPIKKVDITKNFLRYRLTNPKKLKRFRTVVVTRNIRLVIGFKK